MQCLGDEGDAGCGVPLRGACDDPERLVHLAGLTLRWAAASVLGLPAHSPTVEYEVLGVAADHLYFGERPVDGSFLTSTDARPKAVLVPLMRQ